MIALNKHRPLPIGLHLGRQTATLVQLTGTPDCWAASKLAWGEMPFDEQAPPEEQDEAVASALRKLIGDHRFKGNHVVSCLGSQELFVQNVRLPQLPDEELEKVVRWEAEERLPYSVAEAEVRHLSAGQVRQDSNVKQEVILLACQREVVNRHVRLLERAGLVPVAVDIEPCAVLRCFENAGLGEQGDRRLAFLNLGERAATVIFAEGTQIQFIKSITSGGYDLDMAVARSLNLSLSEASKMRAEVTMAASLDAEDELHRSVIGAIRQPLEAMTAEIELCLRYYKVTFRGKPLEKIIVTGSEASSWLVEYLEERLGTSCKLGNPLSLLAEKPQLGVIEEPAGRWATAMGLSLKAPWV